MEKEEKSIPEPPKQEEQPPDNKEKEETKEEEQGTPIVNEVEMTDTKAEQ